VDVPKEGIVHMPKTKATARKGRKCPLQFYMHEEMTKHKTSCRKALIYCDHLKSRNTKRHLKRKHDLIIDREQVSGGVESGDQGNGDSAEESWR
jgi:hypothetical protein